MSVLERFDLRAAILDPCEKLILADALEDEGRLAESACLRGGKAVMVTDCYSHAFKTLVAEGYGDKGLDPKSAALRPERICPVTYPQTFNWKLGPYAPWGTRRFRKARVELSLTRMGCSMKDYDTGAEVKNAVACRIDFVGVGRGGRRQYLTTEQLRTHFAHRERLEPLMALGREWGYNWEKRYTKRQEEALTEYNATHGMSLHFSSLRANYLRGLGLLEDMGHRADWSGLLVKVIPEDTITLIVSFFTTLE